MKISFLNNTKPPRVIYTTNAFIKMMTYLQSEHSKTQEFMFLGEVENIDNDFLITDFYLPPQITRSAYCETDDKKYPEWLIKNIPVEKRSLIRCHAHSHVNMATHPSGTDDKMIAELCENVSDYFIQLIINRKLENTINILNKKQNLIYENVENYIAITEKDYRLLIKLNSITDMTIEDIYIEKENITIENGKYVIDETFKHNIKENYDIINIDNKVCFKINGDKSSISISLEQKELTSLNNQFNKMCNKEFTPLTTLNNSKQAKPANNYPYYPYSYYDYDDYDEYYEEYIKQYEERYHNNGHK